MEKSKDTDRQLAQRTSDLSAAQSHISLMEERHAESVGKIVRLSEEYDSRTKNAASLTEEIATLREKSRILEESATGERKLMETVNELRRAVDEAMREGEALRREVEERTAELTYERNVAGELKRGMEVLRQAHSTALAEQQESLKRMDDRGYVHELPRNVIV